MEEEDIQQTNSNKIQRLHRAGGRIFIVSVVSGAFIILSGLMSGEILGFIVGISIGIILIIVGVAINALFDVFGIIASKILSN